MSFQLNSMQCNAMSFQRTNRIPFKLKIVPCSRNEAVTVNLGASTFAFDLQVCSKVAQVHCTATDDVKLVATSFLSF